MKWRLLRQNQFWRRYYRKRCHQDVSRKHISTVVIDVSAILYPIPWTASHATVGAFVAKFRNYIKKQLQSYDFYLVFDWYREYNTKGVTRVSRGAQFSRVHQLTTVTPIPPPKVILTIPDNKCQLIGLIVDDLCSNTVFPGTSIIIIFSSYWRRSCFCGINIYCYNQTRRFANKPRRSWQHTGTSNGCVASEENKGVSVISNNTDVFVLLLHHYVKQKLTGVVIMESHVKDSHNWHKSHSNWA